MTYNNIRHLELLKRFLYLKTQAKYIELQNYRCALYQYIFWEKKENFILLMENYTNN